MIANPKNERRSHMPNNDPPIAPIPIIALRGPAAAESISISERKLQELVKAGEIPHVRLDGCVLFPVRELADWLTSKTIPARGVATGVERGGGGPTKTACLCHEVESSKGQ